jgi:hypothetical protein
MEDKNVPADQPIVDGPGTELKDAEADKIAGGFNPQPDPPG